MERGKPCKKIEGKQQKIEEKPLLSRREKEKFEKLLKSEFEQVKLSFKKKNLIHKFRLIETDKGSSKNFETISIDRKTASIDRNSRKKHSFEKKKKQFLHKILQALKNMSKMHENEMQSFSKTQVFPKIRFSNIL